MSHDLTGRLSAPSPLTTVTHGLARAPGLFQRALAVVAAWHKAHAATTAQSSREADAAAVRRYAMEVQRDDPRYAADLFAAADRHELGA